MVFIGIAKLKPLKLDSSNRGCLRVSNSLYFPLLTPSTVARESRGTYRRRDMTSPGFTALVMALVRSQAEVDCQQRLNTHR